MTEPAHPEVVEVHEGPGALTVVRRAIPWVLLVVLLFVVVRIVGDFRTAQTAADRAAAGQANPLLAPQSAATAKPGGATSGAKPAAPAKPGPTVVVLMDGVNFRAAPTNGSKVIAALSKGAVLKWVATEGRWFKARDAQGRTGYLSANPTLATKR